MKGIIKEFCKRGLMWGSWGGPVILAIVWICLEHAKVITTLSVDEVVLGIFSTILLGFIAAGITVIYQIESIPKGFAGLIQCSVLYLDYLGIYILNGWISSSQIFLFTIIFVAIFVTIWLLIYIPIKIKVAKINKMLQQ